MSDVGMSDLADEIKRSDTQELSLRLAEVESIQSETVTIRVAGSTSVASGVDYVGYAPKVGDVVLVFQNGPNLIIWGIPGSTGGIPTGAVIKYWDATPPPGYLLCNGQSTSGYPALAAIRANVPDLRDKFIVGAGSSYANGNTGGVATHSGVVSHTHSLNNHEHTLGQHNHPGFNHNHGTGLHTTGNEAGGFGLGASSSFQDRVMVPGAGGQQITGSDGAAYFTGNNPAGTKTGFDGGGGVIGAPSGSVAELDNRPPYYALTYIIKT